MAKEDFKFDFEPTVIQILLAGNKEWENWYIAMCEILPSWGIDTIDRVAAFIAQCAHESRSFNVLTENLNYSSEALNKIFPKYFKNAGRNAENYHRQPEKIANVIYANRMANGDVDSGDGWRFRGGGILQLTGRHNYTEFGKAVGMSAEEAVNYVRTKEGALASACWFWNSNNINKYCDARDIVGMTKKINGGTIGLEDRKKHYLHALDVCSGGTDCTIPEHAESNTDSNQIARKGSRGELVKRVQGKLNLRADGIFGSGTESAVKNWQKIHNLLADGIVGQKTLETMESEPANGSNQFACKGSRGDLVKKVQQKLNLSADGIFGTGTESALKDWQKKHALLADGIVGQKTLKKMNEEE